MLTLTAPSPAALPSSTSTTGPDAVIATAEGTRRLARRFASRFAPGFHRAIPARGTAPGAVVSAIGVGTYLGSCTDEDDARYEQTLVAALADGCNVIDTAINYRCQRSERAVGRALATAIATGSVQRDEVVVCTKGGFVALNGAAPRTRAEYDAYLERELFAPGVLQADELAHGGHAMTPGFLAHQIALSRANLGIETIDLYYLHEPERQLLSLAPDAFARALRSAIEALEAAVTRGEIARWGVASWRGLRVAPTVPGHLALGAIVDAARDVAGERHHFAAVQVPISLAMSEAARAPTQPIRARDGTTRHVPLLQAAHALRVPVVASSPLMEGQLATGLPESVRVRFHGCETDAQRAISAALDLPGVCTTLVGMRSVAHLRENLRIAR